MKDQKNRRQVASRVMLALPLLVALGCAADPSADAGVPEIALVMKSLANEFFATMADGARAHQAENAELYTLVANGTRNEGDLAQQVSLVEQMIARGVDAIVIAPADSKALVPVLGRARAAGIQVVNIDNRLDASALADAALEIPFVGPDNRQGARQVGDALSGVLPAASRVALIEGIPTAFNSQQRRAGFEDAMDAGGHEVVDVQSGGWEQGEASVIAAGMLRAHPDLAAILCANDSMALGAAAAVAQAGRDEVQIVGFDNIAAIQALVLEGRVLATADQHGDQLAVYGIEAALDILSGGAPPEDRETPVDLVTRETLAP